MTPTGPAMPIPDDVEAAVQGDPAALRRVLAELYPLVLRYCRGRLGPGAAVDAAEETIRRVGRALPPVASAFPALVYRTAREVADQRAAAPDLGETGQVAVLPRRRLHAVPDLPAGQAVGHRTPGAAATAALLRMLPADLREVLVLRVAAGLPVGAVAGLVGLSPEAVRVTQHRALARLRSLSADPGVA